MIYQSRLLLPAVFVVLLVSATTVFAESPGYDLKFSLNSGYIGNLIKDSSSREESYTTPGASLNLYPFSVAQVNLIGEYTYYSKLYDLSNLLYGAGLKLVPTDDSSRISVYSSGNFKKRRYRQQDLEVSTTNTNSIDFDALLSVGYRLKPNLQLRTGISFIATDYSDGEIPDKSTYDLFVGGNMTIFKSNSLDLEAGYSTGEYRFAPSSKMIFGAMRFYGIPANSVYSVLETDDLKSFYFSPRISRPIGSRTGMNLTYAYRGFIDRNDSAIVYGYSTGVISPWVSSWEGQAISASIKTFIIPHLIVTLAAGYWDKEYFITLEQPYIRDNLLDPNSPLVPGPLSTNPIFLQSRHDYQRRVSLSFSIPLASRSGHVMEPSLAIDYTNNSSSIVVYDYTDFSITTSLSLRL